MMGIEREQQNQLEDIIVNKRITPVFQPIVSLQDGSVLGFEALSRMTQPGVFNNIEELFKCAERNGRTWQLEQVCRRAILREISHQKETLDQYNGKIFINVNPKVLYDEKFRLGFTKEYTKRYGIDAERIVFEITERERIENELSFQEAVTHYKMQNYQIAIDDVGSGYAGLNRVCSLSPKYIKLDIALVKDVHKNPIKYAMIKGMVEFSHNSGTLLIAEGIETKKELELLIDLGVQYGQGFYLSRPAKELLFNNQTAIEEILKKSQYNHKNNHYGLDGHTFLAVAMIPTGFASSFPGSVRAFEISPGNEIIAQKTAFLASEASVDCSIHFTKKFSTGLFGGEGFILQRFSGNGILFTEFDGHVIEYELQAGQQIVIDTGHLAAMSATCQMEIVSVPGVKNMLFGGEGVFNTVVTGPGHIWLQTMPISNVAGALRPYLPSGNNN